MKTTILTTVICLLLCTGLKAQDVIVKKSGEEIKARVMEIKPTEVRYKLFDYPDGPTTIVATSDLFMIRFENGMNQLFGPANPKPAITESIPEFAPPQPAPPVAPGVVRVAGPRIGATLIGPGKVARKLREDYEAQPLITQFGWQFETRFFTAENGMAGLVEWIPLIGGLEQGLFLPSLSAIIGVRTGSGIEFGAGPNISISGTGMAFAAGVTLKNDYVNFPINLAVVPSKHGVRYGILTGFNLRKL